MLNLDDLTYRIRLDDSEVERTAAATAAQMQRLGSAVTPAQRQFAELNKNTKLTRQEMLALNYTVNDVAASLASGASPFTILLQQGGQVTQAFGGLGATFSKLGSAISIGRVAVSAMAAAVGSLAYAYVEGALESDAFEKAINRTGNAAGLTEASFRKMTRQIAEASGASVGSAREVLSALIATGQFGPKALLEVGTAATAMAKAYGMSASEVVKDFAGMSQGVAKWAAEHNRSMNFITVEQYRYIRALEQQGKVSEAQIETARLVREASTRVTSNLGLLERSWEGVKNAASRAWDAMLNVGRAETTSDAIVRLQRELDTKVARGPLNDVPGVKASYEKGVANLRQEIALLQEKERFERKSAALQAASAEKNRKAIEEERKNEGKKREFDYAITDPLADQKQRFLRSEKEGAEATEEFIRRRNEEEAKRREKEAEDYRRRLETGRDFGQQLIEQAQTVDAQLIADARSRGEALLAIERAQISARITALGLSPEETAQLQDRAAQYNLARERQLTEELKPEYQKRLELYKDFNRYMQQASDEFRDEFIETGRDAFREWVETGKVSASTLTSFIRRKFADMVYDQYLAGIFDQFGKSIFGFLTGFGGGGGGVGITSGSLGLVDLGLGGGRAAGGDVRRGSLHPVNEFGTEVLTMKGKDYLVMGADFGKVSAAGATSSGQGATKQQIIDNSTHIGSVGAGVSRGEVQAMLRDHGARSEARFRRLMADGKV
jgi:phage-related minor tail protein